MKLYLEPVQVTCGEDGDPVSLVWRRRLYRVLEVLERWQYNGKWWTTPGLSGECRHYYRLETGNEVRLEVFESDGGWTLSRLLD